VQSAKSAQPARESSALSAAKSKPAMKQEVVSSVAFTESVNDQVDSNSQATSPRELEGLAESSRLPTPSPVDDSFKNDSLPPALTLNELESLAFAHNPTLAMASARIQAANGRQIQAGLYPNPVIGYHATEVGVQDTAGQQGGFISQRFITGDKLQLDQAIAGKEIDEESFRFVAQETRVLSDVRMRFYDAMVAQRRVKLTNELVDVGERLVVATEKLLRGRQTTENDLLQAEIRADNAHILNENAQNESIETWRRLAAVVGLSNLEPTPLVEFDLAPPNLDWDATYQQLLASHPELDAARTHVDRLRIAIVRAQQEPIPDIDLNVSIRHHNVTDDDVVNVQLGMPLPVFDRNQGNIHAAQAEWVAACNDVQRLELMLQDQFAVTFREFENARQQTERYRERILPKAKKSLDLVTRGYDKGQVEYLTLLNAQQTYVEVSLRHLNAMQAMQLAAAKIEGQLLTGSLTQ